MADFWLPSMGSGEPIPGVGDPSLPGDLAQEFGRRLAEESAADIARVSMLTGEVEKVFRSVVEQMTGLVREVGGVATDVTDQRKEAAREDSRPKSVQPAEPLAPGRHRGDPVEPQGYHPVQAYKEGFSRAQNTTMGGVAQSVSGAAARFVQHHTPAWNREFAEDGTDVLRRYSAEGKILEEIAKGAPGFDETERSVARKMSLAAGLTRFASGQGVGGTLGAFAGRVAGPIGLAVGGAQYVGGKLEEQNAAAAQYRAIYGEDAGGAFAAQERFGRWMEGLRGFGTIGRERAEQQYMAASQMGLRGDRREQATDFATQMYQSIGMETGESMRAVEMAVRGGNVSLSSLSETILDVSRAAVEAGESSQVAVQRFLSAAQYAQQNITMGQGAIGIAQGVEGIGQNLPRGLRTDENIAALTSAISPRNVGIVAAMTGVDRAALQTSVMTGDSNASLQVLEQVGELVVRDVAGTVGLDAAGLRAKVREMFPGARTLTAPQQAQAMAALGIDPANLPIIFGSYGLNFPPAQVIPMFFEILLGAFEAPGAAGRQGVAAPVYGKAEAGSTEAQNRGGELRKAMGFTGMAIAQDTDAFEAYRQRTLDTGRGSKVVEGLLSTQGSERIEEAAGVSSPSDAKFLVRDGGSTKSVTLTEIINNPKYLRQLNAGKVNLQGAGGAEDLVAATEIAGVQPNGGGGRGPTNQVGGVWELKLTGSAERLFEVRGPTSAQRAGRPESGDTDPASYPSWGGGW